MRICLVSTELAGFHGGGIGTYVAEAGRALTAAGHEVWLVTRDPGPERRDQLRAHPAFHRVLLADQGVEAPERFRFALAREAYGHAALAHEALRTAGVEFDYVEFPDYGAEGFVAVREQKLFGTYGSTVLGVTLHSPTHECYLYNQQMHALTPKLRETCVLEEDAIRTAPLLCCPSMRLLEMVTERLRLRRPAGHIVRYPMHLPADLPEPPAPRGRLADLRFLYYGRIEPRKGVQNLVEAFRALPELSVELIGADADCSPLRTSYVEWLARGLPPNVTFSPALPRDELLGRIAAADVCVFPSLWDNWPNACIEAMAAGRVVLGAKHGGMSEMIVHGVSGFLIDGAKPADIARVIREDLGGALDRLDQIGRAAAVRIRELSEPSRYVATLERLVEEKRARPSGVARPTADAASEARVSIVVPYYREDAVMLGEAIDSAIAQTHPNTEILIVDDGSPRADAPDILRQMAARDPRIEVLHKENGGLASARNHAIGRAKGEYCLFLDADNVLRREYAATGAQVLDRFPDVTAVVPQFQVFEHGTGRKRVVVDPLPFDRALSLFRNEFGDAGAMFRTSAFREHGLRYDSMVDMYSDWALWMDCARAGLKVEVIPRILFDYRVHPESMTAREAWDRHLPLLGLLIERHLPPGDAAAERALLVTLVQGWGAGAILAALGGSPKYSEQPVRLARNVQRVSHQVPEAVMELADKVPGLSRLLRWLGTRAIRAHGRFKDRRGRGPWPV